MAQGVEAPRPEGGVLTGRDLLLGSSFHLVSDAEEGGGPALSAGAASAPAASRHGWTA